MALELRWSVQIYPAKPAGDSLVSLLLNPSADSVQVLFDLLRVEDMPGTKDQCTLSVIYDNPEPGLERYNFPQHAVEVQADCTLSQPRPP